MKDKDYERSAHDLITVSYSGTEENHKIQSNKYPGQDPNLVFSAYESTVWQLGQPAKC
jgi:hypothetical protein